LKSSEVRSNPVAVEHKISERRRFGTLHALFPKVNHSIIFWEEKLFGGTLKFVSPMKLLGCSLKGQELNMFA
jgi:hypothetical protein